MQHKQSALRTFSPHFRGERLPYIFALIPNQRKNKRKLCCSAARNGLGQRRAGRFFLPALALRRRPRLLRETVA